MLSIIANRDSLNSNVFMTRSMLGNGSNPAHGDANERAQLPNAPRFSPYHHGTSRPICGSEILYLSTFGHPPERCRIDTLHRDHFTHSILFHIAAKSGRDDLASVHNNVGICELVCEIEVLFDQQDGKPPIRDQRSQRLSNLLYDGRLNSFGRLVQEQAFRITH